MRTQQRIYKSAISDGTRWAAYNHRPGDIFVCTPPKCGTTWMQTIVVPFGGWLRVLLAR